MSREKHLFSKNLSIHKYVLLLHVFMYTWSNFFFKVHFLHFALGIHLNLITIIPVSLLREKKVHPIYSLSVCQWPDNTLNNISYRKAMMFRNIGADFNLNY